MSVTEFAGSRRQAWLMFLLSLYLNIRCSYSFVVYSFATFLEVYRSLVAAQKSSMNFAQIVLSFARLPRSFCHRVSLTRLCSDDFALSSGLSAPEQNGSLVRLRTGSNFVSIIYRVAALRLRFSRVRCGAVPIGAANTKEIALRRSLSDWHSLDGASIVSKFNETVEGKPHRPGMTRPFPKPSAEYMDHARFRLLSSRHKHRVVENNLHCFQARPRSVASRRLAAIWSPFPLKLSGRRSCCAEPCPLITR